MRGGHAAVARWIGQLRQHLPFNGAVTGRIKLPTWFLPRRKPSHLNCPPALPPIQGHCDWTPGCCWITAVHRQGSAGCLSHRASPLLPLTDVRAAQLRASRQDSLSVGADAQVGGVGGSGRDFRRLCAAWTPALHRRNWGTAGSAALGRQAIPPPTATAARQPPACSLPACSEVSIYIQVPPGVRAKQLSVTIQPQHLRVGIQELPPYLDVGAAAGATARLAQLSCCCVA